ncbi:hypothetical protein SeLEV6574_g04327 [Synchytrium endobioticum]|uniref:Uncharacterized protein n=1 Tax=Synchytrium endobioticum TaxID=286115 RepID=A0A507CZT9_9FUNG|nr:hypothetical protein SeLEV6574_g04327 [Synchytrium endobioticum]
MTLRMIHICARESWGSIRHNRLGNTMVFEDMLKIQTCDLVDVYRSVSWKTELVGGWIYDEDESKDSLGGLNTRETTTYGSIKKLISNTFRNPEVYKESLRHESAANFTLPIGLAHC